MRIHGRFGLGHNHIDLAAAQAAGFTITNTPGCLTDCTADLRRPGATVSNTAPGDVMDTEALLEALASGCIRGSGLDVYVEEPQVSEPLRRMKKVALLPPLGSATLEPPVAMEMMLADNLDAFFAGREPQNRVAWN